MNAVFVIDTNVMVAGLLSSRVDSPVVRILDGMLRARFRFVISEALLAEYRSVLLRPKLVKLHRLNALEIDIVLTDLVRHAIVLPAAASLSTGRPPAPDPGDQFLWNLLTSREDLLMVTGDKLLQQPGAPQHRIITPQAFVAQALD